MKYKLNEILCVKYGNHYYTAADFKKIQGRRKGYTILSGEPPFYEVIGKTLVPIDSYSRQYEIIQKLIQYRKSPNDRILLNDKSADCVKTLEDILNETNGN